MKRLPRGYDRFMRLSLIALAGILLLLNAQFAQAARGDHIDLSAGGLTTPGLQISIDLETGIATKKTMPRGVIVRGEKPNWQEVKTQLTPGELRSLKETIRRSLINGLESKACDEQDKAARESGKPLPLRFSADSIIMLDVRLDGRSGHNPARFCESPAFNKLWAAAYRAASSGESPSTSK